MIIEDILRRELNDIIDIRIMPDDIISSDSEQINFSSSSKIIPDKIENRLQEILIAESCNQIIKNVIERLFAIEPTLNNEDKPIISLIKEKLSCGEKYKFLIIGPKFVKDLYGDDAIIINHRYIENIYLYEFCNIFNIPIFINYRLTWEDNAIIFGKEKIRLFLDSNEKIDIVWEDVKETYIEQLPDDIFCEDSGYVKKTGGNIKRMFNKRYKIMFDDKDYEKINIMKNDH